MKKLILATVGLFAANMAFAQGTIQFANTVGVRMTTNAVAQGGGVGNVKVSTGGVADVYYGLFWGNDAGSVTNLAPTLGTNSSVTAGLIGGVTTYNTAGVPGVAVNSQVFIKIVGWSASLGTGGFATALNAAGALFGQTAIFQVTAGASGAPAVIWSGSPNANQTAGLVLFLQSPVPEPTTFALAGLGAAAMLVFRRRKA